MANEKIYEQFRANAKERHCPVCDKKFLPTSATQVYCSHKCQLEMRKIRRARVGNAIAVPKNLSDNMKAIYEMVKDSPEYGLKVARMEGKIK